MKILVTENQLQRILREDEVLLDVIKEQLQQVATNAPATAQVVQNTPPAIDGNNSSLITLENEINKLFETKQTEVLNGASIWIDGTPPELVLHIGNASFNMTPSQGSKNTFFYSMKSGSRMTFGGVNMNTFLPQIEKMKGYQELLKTNPEIKEQVQKGPSVMLYVAQGETGNFIFRQTFTPPILKALPGSEEKKGGALPQTPRPYGTKYPLGEFYSENKLTYIMGKTQKFRNAQGQLIRPKTVYGELESGGISLQVLRITLQPKPTAPVQGQKTVQVTTLDLQDIFNFDDITFNNPTQTNQQINAFVQDLKQKIDTYGAPFVKYLQSQNPTVIGYSSIDGDPNEQINGKYQPCSGYKTRKQYDYCLAGQRAKAIADMLNKALPDMGNAFKSESGGETTAFGRKLGWTPQKKTIPDDTKENRRFYLKPIKPYAATQ